jgi:hypothetical protein
MEPDDPNVTPLFGGLAMRHYLLVLAAAFGMLGLVAPGSSQAAGPQVPAVLVAQYNPYQQQQQQALLRQQQGLLLSQLGVLLAMTAAAMGIFAARARKQKQEREEAEQRQRDAQRRRAEEGERRGNS